MTAALSSHHESPTLWVLLTQLEDGSSLGLEQTGPSLGLILNPRPEMLLCHVCPIPSLLKITMRVSGFQAGPVGTAVLS